MTIRLLITDNHVQIVTKKTHGCETIVMGAPGLILGAAAGVTVRHYFIKPIGPWKIWMQF